jgi:hypothetical protein
MKPIFIANSRRYLVFSSFGWLFLAATLVIGNGSSSPLIASPSSPADGLKAFKDVASVLRSPRCINCHPAGDVPRQTDSQLPHFPAVARGADGHGLTGMRCTACHQETNQANGIPGAPHWGLAPRSMAWAGLDDHELAEQLKDPKRNGSRTLAQMIEHVTSEPLVCWAWQPGGDREAPPLTHEQFIQRFKDWVAAGAPLPQSPKA